MAQGTAKTHRHLQGLHQPLIGKKHVKSHGRGVGGHDRSGIRRHRLTHASHHPPHARPHPPNARTRRPHGRARRANVRFGHGRAGAARPAALAQFRAAALPRAPHRHHRPCGPPAQPAAFYNPTPLARTAHSARRDGARPEFSCNRRQAHALQSNLCVAAASDVRPGEPVTRWQPKPAHLEGFAHGTLA